MIYNIRLGNFDRFEVIQYIQLKQKEGPFKVVDVGGTLSSWSAPYVDAIIDFNPIVQNTLNDNTQKPVTFFQCDITDPNAWHSVLAHVEISGKWDFCICTHTLEDIMNPVFVCRQMEKIASAGYIAFPSKYRELSRFVELNQPFRGYMHHRWIFTIKNYQNAIENENNDAQVIGFPKINYIEAPCFDVVQDMNEDKKDLSFYWKKHIDIEYVNNNFLGPSGTDIKRYYEILCNTIDYI